MTTAVPPFRIAALDLDAPRDQAALRAVLSAGEIAQCRGYRSDRDRNRFVARRGLLRTTLAQIAGESPETLRFASNAFGKPYLPDYPEIRFSTSHSHGQGLIAIALGREIGCDIEKYDPARATPEIADRFFSVRERAMLADLDGAAWVEGFFNAWTRKEAYVKARGTGLSHSLSAFSVSVAPGEPAYLIGKRGWTLAIPTVADGYKAAIAFADGVQTIEMPDSIREFANAFGRKLPSPRLANV